MEVERMEPDLTETLCTCDVESEPMTVEEILCTCSTAGESVTTGSTLKDSTATYARGDEIATTRIAAEAIYSPAKRISRSNASPLIRSRDSIKSTRSSQLKFVNVVNSHTNVGERGAGITTAITDGQSITAKNGIELLEQVIPVNTKPSTSLFTRSESRRSSKLTIEKDGVIAATDSKATLAKPVIPSTTIPTKLASKQLETRRSTTFSLSPSEKEKLAKLKSAIDHENIDSINKQTLLKSEIESDMLTLLNATNTATQNAENPAEGSTNFWSAWSEQIADLWRKLFQSQSTTGRRFEAGKKALDKSISLTNVRRNLGEKLDVKTSKSALQGTNKSDDLHGLAKPTDFQSFKGTQEKTDKNANEEFALSTDNGELDTQQKQYAKATKEGRKSVLTLVSLKSQADGQNTNIHDVPTNENVPTLITDVPNDGGQNKSSKATTDVLSQKAEDSEMKKEDSKNVTTNDNVGDARELTDFQRSQAVQDQTETSKNLKATEALASSTADKQADGQQKPISPDLPQDTLTSNIDKVGSLEKVIEKGDTVDESKKTGISMVGDNINLISKQEDTLQKQKLIDSAQKTRITDLPGETDTKLLEDTAGSLVYQDVIDKGKNSKVGTPSSNVSKMPVSVNKLKQTTTHVDSNTQLLVTDNKLTKQTSFQKQKIETTENSENQGILNSILQYLFPSGEQENKNVASESVRNVELKQRNLQLKSSSDKLNQGNEFATRQKSITQLDKTGDSKTSKTRESSKVSLRSTERVNKKEKDLTKSVADFESGSLDKSIKKDSTSDIANQAAQNRLLDKKTKQREDSLDILNTIEKLERCASSKSLKKSQTSIVKKKASKESTVSKKSSKKSKKDQPSKISSKEDTPDGQKNKIDKDDAVSQKSAKSASSKRKGSVASKESKKSKKDQMSKKSSKEDIFLDKSLDKSTINKQTNKTNTGETASKKSADKTKSAIDKKGDKTNKYETVSNKSKENDKSTSDKKSRKTRQDDTVSNKSVDKAKNKVTKDTASTKSELSETKTSKKDIVSTKKDARARKETKSSQKSNLSSKSDHKADKTSKKALDASDVLDSKRRKSKESIKTNKELDKSKTRTSRKTGKESRTSADENKKVLSESKTRKNKKTLMKSLEKSETRQAEKDKTQADILTDKSKGRNVKKRSRSRDSDSNKSQKKLEKKNLSNIDKADTYSKISKKKPADALTSDKITQKQHRSKGRKSRDKASRPGTPEKKKKILEKSRSRSRKDNVSETSGVAASTYSEKARKSKKKSKGAAKSSSDPDNIEKTSKKGKRSKKQSRHPSMPYMEKADSTQKSVKRSKVTKKSKGDSTTKSVISRKKINDEYEGEGLQSQTVKSKPSSKKKTIKTKNIIKKGAKRKDKTRISEQPIESQDVVEKSVDEKMLTRALRKIKKLKPKKSKGKSPPAKQSKVSKDNAIISRPSSSGSKKFKRKKRLRAPWHVQMSSRKRQRRIRKRNKAARGRRSRRKMLRMRRRLTVSVTRAYIRNRRRRRSYRRHRSHRHGDRSLSCRGQFPSDLPPFFTLIQQRPFQTITGLRFQEDSSIRVF